MQEGFEPRPRVSSGLLCVSGRTRPANRSQRLPVVVGCFQPGSATAPVTSVAIISFAVAASWHDRWKQVFTVRGRRARRNQGHSLLKPSTHATPPYFLDFTRRPRYFRQIEQSCLWLCSC